MLLIIMPVSAVPHCHQNTTEGTPWARKQSEVQRCGGFFVVAQHLSKCLLLWLIIWESRLCVTNCHKRRSSFKGIHSCSGMSTCLGSHWSSTDKIRHSTSSQTLTVGAWGQTVNAHPSIHHLLPCKAFQDLLGGSDTFSGQILDPKVYKTTCAVHLVPLS